MLRLPWSGTRAEASRHMSAFFAQEARPTIDIAAVELNKFAFLHGAGQGVCVFWRRTFGRRKESAENLLGEFLQSGEDPVHKMPSNDHKCFIGAHIKPRSLVAVKPRRPPKTNVDTETAFRHDHCKTRVHIQNTAIHIPPMKCFWTNFCGLCPDLLAFDLNGKVVWGLSSSPLL